MTESVLIAIPVLDRPQRAAAVFESATAAATVPTEIVFVASRGDTRQIAACRATGARVEVVPWRRERGDWARKVDYAIESSDAPWIFTGADDLRFAPAWDVAALAVALQTGARVIGTNDLGNPRVRRGQHSTHSLVARSYVVERGTVDGPGRLFHHGYDHNYPDDEMVETANARGEFAFAAKAVVEHLHPNWRKGESDSTYALGARNFTADRLLFQRRRRLWRGSRAR